MADEYVYPKEKRINMVAYANPVYSSHKVDKAYDEIIDAHIDRINQQSNVIGRDKNSLAVELHERMRQQEPVVYNGQRVSRLFSSLNNYRGQESIDTFRMFPRQDTYFVFDIETFGDTQDHFLPFGVSEISMNEYDRKGNLVRKGYNGIVRQDDDVIAHFSKRLQELRKDKYAYNRMSEWEKRSIVDFMRFSDKGDNPFFLGNDKEEMRHNAIIDSVFDHKDQLEHAKFVREFDMYAEHIESGLQNMSKVGDTQAQALQKVFGLIESNPDSYFVSYNGNSFDVRQLQAMAESQNKKNKKLNLKMPENVKHLDLLNIIRTTFNDPDELKKLMNDSYDPMTDSYSKEKLASYVKSVLGISDKGFHNAKIDVDNTAKLMAMATQHIEKKIHDAHMAGMIQKGFNHVPTHMTWSGQELTHGLKMFASGGVQAFQEGEESFKMALGENGKWAKQSNGFNKTIINSKSFYEFAGHIHGNEAEKLLGDAGKQAFVFFNRDANEYSYIIRNGEHAFNELQDFVHKRFYNYDGIPKQLQSDIVHLGNADRTRRQYERYFSMDGAGRGLTTEAGEVVERGTAGFSGLKRMLHNAQIMKEHIAAGKDYKAKVMALRMQGLSEAEAKRQVRNPYDANTLIERMDFTSKWNPKTGKYEFNVEEKNKFFKMFGRLGDEMPYLNEAINSIDKEFAGDIELASKITDPKQQRATLKQINQKRDFALMRYHQYMVGSVGIPTKNRPLMPFESHQLPYFDAERGADGSLDFSSPARARDSIYGYAKRGVEKDNPNRQDAMKQRLEKLVQTLHGQNIITKKQLEDYHAILDTDNTAYHASAAIATDMRMKNGGKYLTGREEVILHENKKIKQLPKSVNRSFVQRAIEDTKNSMMVIESGSIKSQQLRLQSEWKGMFDVLDETRFSGLQSNNFSAVQELVMSIQKQDPSLHVALAMDGSTADNANLKVYAFKSGDSAHVMNQLARNQAPTQAIEFQMPLINEGGYHRIGNRRLIGHSYAQLDGKKIKEISSAQYIAQAYDESMSHIIGSYYKHGAERATTLAKRRLNDRVMRMSGASPLTGVNDTMDASFNQSDTMKETHIKISNAMVEDLYYNGYDGIKLDVKDFKDGSDVLVNTSEGPRLRRGLTFEDLQTDKMTSIHLKMQKWAKERTDGLGMDLYTDAVKDGKVIEGTLNKQSAVPYRTYGTFDNYGRDNSVQNFNAHQLSDEVFETLKQIDGITTDRSFITDKQLAYEEKVGGNRTAFNGRMAILSQEQFRGRINQMLEDPAHREMLTGIGVLDQEGKINHLAIARVYEQQMAISSDVADALTVHSKKRYDEGAQFKRNIKLSENKLVMPGDFLGTRIHENGKREKVIYEGHSPANVIAGIDDGKALELQWEHDAFKLMVESEKGTISPMNQKFINAMTGREDIIGFFNPDVGKHGDYRLLMSGEARYMAEELQNMGKKARAKALKIIENAGLGLQWDNKNQRFLDVSHDLDIAKDQFNKVFQQLEKAKLMTAPVANGIRFGSYEMKVAKVENYHKAVDSSGRRVIGWRTVGDEQQPIYGRKDGVKWAHREMGIFKDLGMEETYNYVYRHMLDKNSDAIQHVDNVVKSLEYTVGDSSVVDALDMEHFKDLPDELKNGRTYRGTIFDENKVQSLVAEQSAKHGRSSTAMNQHGFYVNLPSVMSEDGVMQKVTINANGGKDGGKAIDKMFIPFTRLEESPTDGEAHLRQLQQHIARIYEKADEIHKAPDANAARHSFKQLNTVVNDYMNFTINKELSSSKGTMLSDAFSTRMHTSASGLFKLMDSETSLKFGEGEHVVINPETARKMGIYNKLMDAQKNGTKVHTAAVRYPSFHKGAIQFAQLHMSDSVKEGEFHTSTFASMLQAADSDGDGDHIVVVDDEKVQAEWAQKHDNIQQEFSNRYEKYLDTEHPEHRKKSNLGANLQNTVKTDDGMIPKNLDPEEALKSKIGKAGIGMASNLGLSMRQVANGYMKEDKAGLHAVQEFTRGLEQKIISSKHGASPTAGRDLVRAVTNGQWDKAKEIDNLNYDGLFQKDFYMNEVAEKFPVALTHTNNGLKSPAMRFGMGNGADPQMGVNKFLSFLNGTAEIGDYSGDSTGLSLYQRHAQGEGGETFPLEGRPASQPTPVPELRRTPMKAASDKRHVIQSIASDAIGGGVSNIGKKLNQAWQSVKGLGLKKGGLLAGGLAVAGITGYNVLNTEKPEMHYNNQEIPSENEQPAPRREPQPAIPTGLNDYSSTQNASINIQASGKGANRDQMSHAVTQGMRESGMNAGPTRVSVSHNDNTQQLNRQWYRDKVRENI